MPLRNHGLCTSLAKWRCFLFGPRFMVRQKRCFTTVRVFRQAPEVTTSFSSGSRFSSSAVTQLHDLPDVCEASRSELFLPTTLPLNADHQLATPNQTQYSPGIGLEIGRETDQNARQSPARHPAGSALRLQRKASRFKDRERHKEDRLLVQQMLKDKGQLSYDWRIALRILEQDYASPIKQDPLREQGPLQGVSPLPRVTSKGPAPCDVSSLNSKTRRIKRHARDIPIPKIWSASVLQNYVQDLADSQFYQDKIPQKSHPKTKGSSNLADVINAFDAIFYSDATEKYLSETACKIALRFYYAFGMQSKARALFTSMEDSKMDISTETFNILLQGAASSRDLHSFTFILQKAIRRGFKPDGQTWNKLLMTIYTTEVRAVIIQRMRERRITEDCSGKGDVTGVLIQHELASHVDTCADRGAFLEYMDNRYGAKWLTTSTGNKLLHEFSKRHDIPAALSLFPGLKFRGFLPDKVSLNTLLRLCLILKQNEHSVETIQSFDFHFGLKPGKSAYEALFLLAWRCRLFNFAKVVWKSACVRGYTTPKMRKLIFRSLVTSASVHTSDSNSVRFNKLAGMFIVDAETPLEGGAAGSNFNDEVGKLIQHQSTFKIAEMRLQRDLQAPARINVRHNLGKMLHLALQFDRQVAAAESTRTAAWQQIVQSGIDTSFTMRIHPAPPKPSRHLPYVRKVQRYQRLSQLYKERRSGRDRDYTRSYPAKSIRQSSRGTITRVRTEGAKRTVDDSNTRKEAQTLHTDQSSGDNNRIHSPLLQANDPNETRDELSSVAPAIPESAPLAVGKPLVILPQEPEVPPPDKPEGRIVTYSAEKPASLTDRKRSLLSVQRESSVDGKDKIVPDYSLTHEPLARLHPGDHKSKNLRIALRSMFIAQATTSASTIPRIHTVNTNLNTSSAESEHSEVPTPSNASQAIAVKAYQEKETPTACVRSLYRVPASSTTRRRSTMLASNTDEKCTARARTRNDLALSPSSFSRFSEIVMTARREVRSAPASIQALPVPAPLTSPPLLKPMASTGEGKLPLRFSIRKDFFDQKHHCNRAEDRSSPAASQKTAHRTMWKHVVLDAVPEQTLSIDHRQPSEETAKKSKPLSKPLEQKHVDHIEYKQTSEETANKLKLKLVDTLYIRKQVCDIKHKQPSEKIAKKSRPANKPLKRKHVDDIEHGQPSKAPAKKSRPIKEEKEKIKEKTNNPLIGKFTKEKPLFPKYITDLPENPTFQKSSINPPPTPLISEESFQQKDITGLTTTTVIRKLKSENPSFRELTIEPKMKSALRKHAIIPKIKRYAAMPKEKPSNTQEQEVKAQVRWARLHSSLDSVLELAESSLKKL